MRRIPAKAAVLAAVTALVLAAFGGVASAAKVKKPGPLKLATSPQQQVSGNQSIAIATASCPKGTRATGGGFSATPSSPDVVFHVFESQKVGQNQWRVSGQVADTAGPADPVVLTANAYCRKRAPKMTTELTTVQTTGTPGGAGPLVTASCNKGKALAGGFLVPASVGPTGAYANIITDSARVGKDSWQINVESTAGSPAGSATAFVYCAKLKKPHRLPTPVSATSPVNTTFASQVTATATCAGKVGPLAGGFTQTGVSAANGLYLYESVPAGLGYRVSAVHAGLATPSTLTTIAYCG